MGRRVPILMYHSVADEGPPGLFPYRVSCTAFREQMRFLVERGYYSVSLEDWARCIAARQTLPGRPVIITFDDGYRNFYQNARPILAETGLQATIFVVTGSVGGTNDWDAGPGDALKLMDWDELRALQRLGHTIASHCAAHRDLTGLSDEEIAGDCVAARARLCTELGLETRAVAFPGGGSNTRVRYLLADNGYRIGVAAAGGLSTLSDDAMNLPRIEICGDDDLDAFALKIDADNHEGGWRAILPAPGDNASPGETLATGGGVGRGGDVTVVVTSCGRQDLLERTLDSFFAFNTCPLGRIIVVEDGLRRVNAALMRKYLQHDITWVETGSRVGQIAAIDYAYSFVGSRYIFHLEDDWEFLQSGFIEKSRAVLEAIPDCLQVWLRAIDDTNAHPLCPEIIRVGDLPLRQLQLDHLGVWSGFSLNPGLRRTADYRRIGTYGAHATDIGRKHDEAESALSVIYRQLGFHAVLLADHGGTGYVRHIGDGRRISANGGGRDPSADDRRQAVASM